MKKLLFACAFVMGISAVSFAQGGGGRGARTPEAQLAQLKTSIAPLTLTDDQAAKLTVVYTAASKSNDSLRAAPGYDRTTARPAMMAIQTATTAKINAILTADQAAAYKKAMDARRAQFGGGGGGGN
jgi:protein CpxP